VAVATIVTRERKFLDGALIGVFWGLGHMATVTLAGAILVALNLTLPAPLTTGLELLVAAMLVLLGVLRLRDAARGLGEVGTGHLAADHDHGGAAAVHSHPHVHAGHAHSHAHLHPSPPLTRAIARGRGGLAARAIMVGAVHGLAGSAAIALLVLATLHSVASAVAYLLIFGLGTITGMTLLTAAMAYPVSLALRLSWVRRALALGAGAGSIAFGIFYAVRTLTT
jgi:hypothetical protein